MYETYRHKRKTCDCCNKVLFCTPCKNGAWKCRYCQRKCRANRDLIKYECNKLLPRWAK